MTENTKPRREFHVVGDANGVTATLLAKSPRDAAVKTLNTGDFAHEDAVEVFEFGRGKRYVRQATAVPAGKAG